MRDGTYVRLETRLAAAEQTQRALIEALRAAESARDKANQAYSDMKERAEDAEAREREAYAACERIAQRWIDPDCGCDACQVQREIVKRIRALSPQTIVGQGVKDETTMKGD